MPSFDVVSKVDLQEVDNAVNQAMKEIRSRFDFKKSKSRIERTEEGILIVSDDDFKIKSVIDVLESKLVRRKVPVRALKYGKIEPAAKGLVKQTAAIQQGIPEEKAKQIIKDVKNLKLKVQGQIQGDQVRFSGKKRDNLQEVIAFLKEKDYGIDMNYLNFRD